ncbi:MAG: hypothetical protein LBR34_03825, partial [Prevotella sp.]|nr:hypothetical protein [Prevotella sp.]
HCHLGSITLENCLFVNNTSTGNGGAIQVGGGVSATVINCTFANNKSVKPGGAIGLGTNTSNLTVINTIAYNNLYNETTYNSYGQNDNINGGGTVISKNSAIESASTKFTDGDDVAHLTLTREISPAFVSPSATIGYIQDGINQIALASYRLDKGSPCIDAGDDSYAAGINLDLNGNPRIQGLRIDMGAYEYESSTSAIASNMQSEEPITLQYKEGKIHINGAETNDNLMIYGTNGTLLYRSKIVSGENTVKWNSKGFYFIKIENRLFKLLVQ